MKLRSKAVASVLAAAITVAACGGSADDAAPAAQDPAPAGSDAPAAESSLLSGSVPTVTGSQVDLAGFEGKDVLVWVWAPW